MNTFLGSLQQKFLQNWKAGLTVALVSIPLSVSLAVASNTSPVAGIVTAIWAGLFASIFGGSNYNIVGPTGALSGILATYAIVHGAQTLPTLAIITGVFVIIAYLLRLEKYLVFIPGSTIQGFTLGVAFIIALNQMNFALGLNNLPKHEKFINNIIESLMHIQDTSFAPLSIFVIFLFGLFLLLKMSPKLPGAIILSPIGILLGYLSETNSIPIKLLTLGAKYTDIDPRLFLPYATSFDVSLVSTGLVVALVAILETMISAKIADGMTKTKHHRRKELFGLGLANLASGLAGGIPATAALARTSLNIKTNATDKLSATISSICIFLISFIFLSYFRYIPLAVIASILVFTAYRMIELPHLKRLFSLDKTGFVLAMIVAGVTIYEDPIIGILLGTALSLILFVEKLSKGQFDLAFNDPKKGLTKKITTDDAWKKITAGTDTMVYSIKGQLAYINGQAHIARFEQPLNGYKNIIFRLRELYFIDPDGLEAFEEIVELARDKNKQVIITGINPMIESMFKQSHIYIQLKKNGNIFPKTADALIHLGYKIS